MKESPTVKMKKSYEKKWDGKIMSCKGIGGLILSLELKINDSM
jgi:hypothetical protein